MRMWFYLKFTYPFKGWVLRKFFAYEVEYIRDSATQGHAEHVTELLESIQFLVNFMDSRGLLEEGSFTFPDGETWYVAE